MPSTQKLYFYICVSSNNAQEVDYWCVCVCNIIIIMLCHDICAALHAEYSISSFWFSIWWYCLYFCACHFVAQTICWCSTSWIVNSADMDGNVIVCRCITSTRYYILFCISIKRSAGKYWGIKSIQLICKG